MNPTNIGAIFRSAAALNMDAVLVTPTCCDPLYRRSVRVSMGTVFQIPWSFLPDTPDYCALLHDLGFKTCAMALTDRSGRIRPISIPVPDLSESQSPDPPEKPYTNVNLYARKKGYEQVESENLQVFADTTTLQNLEMIPLAELPGSWNQVEIIDTPPQNL